MANVSHVTANRPGGGLNAGTGPCPFTTIRFEPFRWPRLADTCRPHVTLRTTTTARDHAYTAGADYNIGQFKLRHPEVYSIADAGGVILGRWGHEIFALVSCLCAYNFVVWLVTRRPAVAAPQKQELGTSS